MSGKITSTVKRPQEWRLPDPKKVIATLRRLKPKKGKKRKRRGSQWIFSDTVSPLDLYAYLKWRFGDPNGFLMMGKLPTVDNLIHWNYTLECPGTVIDIIGLNVRTEIRSYDAILDSGEWEELESNLLEEFKSHQRDLREVRNTFERWHLFLNPYKRLSTIIDRYEEQLNKLEISSVKPPKLPSRREDVAHYTAEMTRCTEIYQEAMAICVSLEMIAPIMGEAAINFLILALAKQEVRKDQRVYQDLARRNIDVRIKSLHLFCDGFSKPIDGSEEPFKEFLRLMNRRNDSLHGNIDPQQSTGAEIYFDHRTIPLLPRQKGLSELALEHAFANLTPGDVLKDIETVRRFVDFLLSRLRPEIRGPITQFLDEQQLGYRPKTGTIGVILPRAYVDIIPILDSEDSR